MGGSIRVSEFTLGGFVAVMTLILGIAASVATATWVICNSISEGNARIEALLEAANTT